MSICDYCAYTYKRIHIHTLVHAFIHACMENMLHWIQAEAQYTSPYTQLLILYKAAVNGGDGDGNGDGSDDSDGGDGVADVLTTS